MGRVQFFTWLMGLIPLPHEIYVKKITFLTFRFHFCSFLYPTFHPRKEKELLISVAGKNNLRFITCEEPITVIEQSFQPSSTHIFYLQLSKLQLFLNKLLKCCFTTFFLFFKQMPLNETNFSSISSALHSQFYFLKLV